MMSILSLEALNSTSGTRNPDLALLEMGRVVFQMMRHFGGRHIINRSNNVTRFSLYWGMDFLPYLPRYLIKYQQMSWSFLLLTAWDWTGMHLNKTEVHCAFNVTRREKKITTNVTILFRVYAIYVSLHVHHYLVGLLWIVTLITVNPRFILQVSCVMLLTSQLT